MPSGFRARMSSALVEAGHRRHPAAPLLEGPEDIPLGAVVQKHHMVLLLAQGGIRLRGGTGGVGHGVVNRVGGDVAPILGNGVGDHGVDHAVFPDAGGELPGVHAPEAGDMVLFQEVIHGVLAAEVAGRRAPLLDHVAEEPGRSFKILLHDAVVADQGEGLENDLAIVAGIGQGLHIAHHIGGEDQLADDGLVGAEGPALENRAVSKIKYRFFMGSRPFRGIEKKWLFRIPIPYKDGTAGLRKNHTYGKHLSLTRVPRRKRLLRQSAIRHHRTSFLSFPGPWRRFRIFSEYHTVYCPLRQGFRRNIPYKIPENAVRIFVQVSVWQLRFRRHRMAGRDEP